MRGALHISVPLDDVGYSNECQADLTRPKLYADLLNLL